MKKRFMAVALGIMALFGSAGSAEANIPWLNSMAQARTRAIAERKPIMAYFYTDWCGWCKKLDADTFQNPQLQQMLRGVVPVKLNAEAEGTTLAQQLNVKGYPHIIFLDTNGNVIDRMAGYLPAEGFALEMNRMLGDRLRPAAYNAAPSRARAGALGVAAPTRGMPSYNVRMKQHIQLQKALANKAPRASGMVIADNSNSTLTMNSDGILIAGDAVKPAKKTVKKTATGAAKKAKANRAAQKPAVQKPMKRSVR
jgi:thioredoxin-related protein